MADNLGEGSVMPVHDWTRVPSGNEKGGGSFPRFDTRPGPFPSPFAGLHNALRGNIPTLTKALTFGNAPMSSSIPTAEPPVAPFQIYSVHFDFPGGQAINLRDPATDQLIGATPEWLVGARNELAAYVRSTRPEIRVIFRATPVADGAYTVGADGLPFQIDERHLTLVFLAPKLALNCSCKE